MEKLEAGHPATQSKDVASENLDRLRELFPEAFTEGQVDFDVLRELLGNAVDTGDEKYGLTWHGKRKARRLALTPSTGALRPAPEESVDWETTQNLMIEGDNLEVLKLLQKSYAGKVKLIYIDPPYNTGNDFVYPDDFRDSIRNYLELTRQVDGEGKKVSSNTDTGGRFHTAWLNMMYPRLKLARSTLRQDGVVFASIDDVEKAHLQLMMDEVFGRENFLGCIVIRTATDNNPTQVSTQHEYMLVYAKNREHVGNWSRPSRKAAIIAEKHEELRRVYGDDVASIQSDLRRFIRENEDQLAGVTHYDNVDHKGVFHDGDVANTRFGGYEYAVLHPVTGKPCKVPEKGFRFPEATMREMIEADDIMFGADETTLIKPKKRLETVSELLRSVIYEDGRASTRRVERLMARGVFDNPKSDTILRDIIEFATAEGDLILDFFAGSGTTADAAMNLNAELESSRRFILVQLPEPLDPDQSAHRPAIRFCDEVGIPRTIAELTKERLRRVGREVRTGERAGKVDLGFRVFKLDSSGIRPWDPRPEDLEATLFENVDHLKDDRTEDDILFELLLKLGLDLTVPMEERTIAGKRVHSIGGGVLFVCLATEVRAEDAEALAMGIVNWRDDRDPAGEVSVVFRDSGFENDVAKSNVAAILEQRGVETVRSL
jgi:adenine-specific DNA-methyltransferase